MRQFMLISSSAIRGTIPTNIHQGKDCVGEVDEAGEDGHGSHPSRHWFSLHIKINQQTGPFISRLHYTLVMFLYIEICSEPSDKKKRNPNMLKMSI